MAVDAMYKLEHGVGDKAKAKEVDPILKELEEFQATRWHDDYSSNQALRAKMRVSVCLLPLLQKLQLFNILV